MRDKDPPWNEQTNRIKGIGPNCHKGDPTSPAHV